ncbi:MAG: glycine cleavage system protein GcvH [Thermoplasmata archaeon]
MEIKQGLKYAKTHEWVQVTGSSARIGISDYAQQQLTDIVYMELPDKGAKIKKGQTFGVLESVKAVEDIYAPVSGTVLQKNQNVIDNPDLLNNDPYNAWLIEIKLDNDKELNELMDDKAYTQFLATQKH